MLLIFERSFNSHQGFVCFELLIVNRFVRVSFDVVEKLDGLKVLRGSTTGNDFSSVSNHEGT
jgi:hypothetical protein